MSKTMLKNTSLVLVQQRRSTYARVRELFEAGKYTYLVRLLGRIDRDGALENWRALACINLGWHQEAQQAISNALALGYRGARGALAVVQRLTEQNRDWLTQLSGPDFEGLSNFDRAILEREIGIEAITHNNDTIARDWLETAWKSALSEASTHMLLPSIGEPLGLVLGRIGHHAQAVSVIDEALKYATVQRRVPLLLLRATWGLYLSHLEQVERDLADAATFVPDLPNDKSLTSRLAYLEGRLMHARGSLDGALERFDEAAELAQRHDQDATEFYALLWAYTTVLEMGHTKTLYPEDSVTMANLPPNGPEIYEMLLRERCQDPEDRRERAWYNLRTSLYRIKEGDTSTAIDRVMLNSEALRHTQTALESFERIGARWEIGAVWLARAELSLSAPYSSDREPRPALEAALKAAHALGGTVQYTTELRLLPKVRDYLGTLPTNNPLKAFLNTHTEYTHIRVLYDRIEVNGAPTYLRGTTAALLRYLARYPRSAWRHLALTVYPMLTEQGARQEFGFNRLELRELGVEVRFDNLTNNYSAVWGTVTLEISDEPVEEIVFAAREVN
jgi:tetratricopeptide (TPR) repeat protein